MRFLRAAAFLTAALHCVLFLTVVFLRIRYPYELEWIEGGILQHVQRILAGLPLFTAPSLDWTPLLYGPLYYFVSAAVTRVVGEGFLPLRLVSFASSVGVAVTVFWLVRHETRSRAAGFLASAFFIAGYKTMGSWYDIARVDGIFVLLLMAAVVAYRCYRGTVSALLAALLLGVAFLAKQTTLVAVAPLMIWALWRERRRALWLVSATAVSIAAIMFVGQMRTGGWFLYYTMGLAGKHPVVKPMLIDFWIGDVLAPSSVAVLFAAFFFWFQGTTSSRERPDVEGSVTPSAWGSRPREFYAVLAIGMGGASWGSRLHEGGWFNVLMPGFAALAVLFGLGIHVALSLIHARLDSLRGRMLGLVYLAVTIQFVRCAYNPFQEIPSRADRETGDRIVETLSRAPGDVFVPDHPYLAIRAGKRGTAHRAAIDDIMRTHDAHAKELEAQLPREVEDRKFVAALVDNGLMLPLLGDSFHKEPDLIRDDSFWPVVGMKTRPAFLFVREEDAAR
ncbi:MAG: glycosyltransferase family 39 protein [Candidatus Eisenbacteria bacterium]